MLANIKNDFRYSLFVKFEFFQSHLWNKLWMILVIVMIHAQALISQNVLNGNYPNWARIANSPSKKVESQGVVYNNKLYVFTGIYGYIDETQTGSARYKLVTNITTEAYNPTLNSWTILAPLPDPQGLTHYGISLVDDKVWLVGGKLNAILEVTNKVWIYNITTNTWASGPALPNNLASGALVKLGRKLHFFAGGTHLPSNQKSLCILTNYHYVLDLNNQTAGWKTGEFMPLPTHIQSIHSSVAQMGGQFYLMGGQYGHDCENQGDTDHKKVFRFNPYLNRWEALASLPTINSHNEGATFAVDGKVYSIGGQLTGNEVRAYNPSTNTWQITDYLKDEFGNKLELIGPIAKVIQNKIFLVNGGLELSNYKTTEKGYIKNFSRTYNNNLVFLPDTIRQTMNQYDAPKQVSAWLSTLNGKATYAVNLNNLPVWLQSSKDAGNTTDETATEFKISFLPAQVATGNYYYPLVATAAGYASKTLHIYLKVTNQPLSTPVLSLGNISQTSVALSWTASNNNVGLTSYEVFEGNTLVGTTTNLNLTVNGLSANTEYNFSVKAKDEANNSSNLSNIVYATTLLSTPSPQQITRINAGGTTQTVNGITWSGCTTGNCNLYVTSGNAYTQSGNPFINGVVSPLNQAIFQTEWTGGGATGQVAFSFNIPVANGNYLIRLHFAELNKNGAGLRKFDVNIEGGAKELVNFDIFALAGYRTAMSREFTFNITDGFINIDFIRQVENAKVSAIEIILQTPAGDTQVPSAPVLSLGIVSQTSVALNWTGSTDNVGVSEYNIFNGAILVGTTSNLNFTVNNLTANTVYSFTVKAKDAAGNSSVASNVINATTLAPPTSVRFEAETNFTVISNVGTNGNIVVGNNNIASVGKDVRAYDIGDKFKINFSAPQSGQYRLKVRARSGTSANSTLYWTPLGYSFKLNNTTTSFTGTSQISATSTNTYGNGAYFGIIQSNILNLNAGTHSLEITMTRSWLGVDYLDVEYLGSTSSVANVNTTENTLQTSEAITLPQDISKLYPNPNNDDEIYVEFTGNVLGKVEYSISNAQGKTFTQQIITLDEPQYVIKIAIANLRLSEGVYYLYIKGDKLQEKTIRFVKN